MFKRYRCISKNLTRNQTCPRQLFRPSLGLISRSQVTTPMNEHHWGLSPVPLLSSDFTWLLELRVHGLVCVSSVYHEGWGGSERLVGLIPTLTTCSRHNTSRLTWPNILLAGLQAVLQLKNLLPPCTLARDRRRLGQLFRPSLGLIKRS